MSSTPSSNNAHRVAIVTGASGGIGHALAKRLAADGMPVIVHYAGDPERAEETVTAVTATGGTASAVRADVAEEDEVSALFDRAEQLYAGIDVVVHAVGVMFLSPLADLSLDDLDTMHRVNVRGTFVVDQQPARRLRTGGAIINFSSSVAKIALGAEPIPLGQSQSHQRLDHAE